MIFFLHNMISLVILNIKILDKVIEKLLI